MTPEEQRAWAAAGRALEERDRLREEAKTLQADVADHAAKITGERDEALRRAAENEKEVAALVRRVFELQKEGKRARALIASLTTEDCHANRDGECSWDGCTQNKPETRLNWCPYARDEDEEES
jgi:hypothetical protein